MEIVVAVQRGWTKFLMKQDTYIKFDHSITNEVLGVLGKFLIKESTCLIRSGRLFGPSITNII